MRLIVSAFGEVLSASVDRPSPTIIARGHANGNQGCWLLETAPGEAMPELLLDEPEDSPWSDSR